MKIGPRYKKARRLGVGVFDKTQTAKYSAWLSRKEKSAPKQRSRSEYGAQLLEKQKARFTYGVPGRQFNNYVEAAIDQKKMSAEEQLYQFFETRLDNVIYRLGLANSRQFARQIASHGHMTVNGVRSTIPSMLLKVGDKVAIRPASAKKKLFEKSGEKLALPSIPAWIKANAEKGEAEIAAMPKYIPSEHQFDLTAIIEFYKR